MFMSIQITGASSFLLVHLVLGFLFVCLLACLLRSLFVCLFDCPSVRPNVRAFARSFVGSFVGSFVRSLVRSFCSFYCVEHFLLYNMSVHTGVCACLCLFAIALSCFDVSWFDVCLPPVFNIIYLYVPITLYRPAMIPTFFLCQLQFALLRAALASFSWWPARFFGLFVLFVLLLPKSSREGSRVLLLVLVLVVLLLLNITNNNDTRTCLHHHLHFYICIIIYTITIIIIIIDLSIVQPGQPLYERTNRAKKNI